MTSGESHDTHSSQSLEKIITLALDRCTFAYLNRTNSEQVQGKRQKHLPGTTCMHHSEMHVARMTLN